MAILEDPNHNAPLEVWSGSTVFADDFWKLNHHDRLTRPRGGTLIFSHIRRLRLFFGGSKFWILIFFGVSRKMNTFWGYEDFVDIFWGSSQNWASLRVISMHFRVFFKVKVQNWDIFWIAKTSNIFWGAWNSWYFLGVNGRCWAPSLHIGKN